MLYDVKIHTYPDPFLRKKSIPVEQFDDALRDFVNMMVKVMKEQSGVGLAAPQIGYLQRVLVVDTEVLKIAPEKKVLINPQIISFSQEIDSVEEGCLSVPEIQAQVKRPVGIRFKYYDETGQCHEGEDASFWARVVQHEIDHLDGILFIDRISTLRKKLVRKRLQQLRKIYQE